MIAQARKGKRRGMEGNQEGELGRTGVGDLEVFVIKGRERDENKLGEEKMKQEGFQDSGHDRSSSPL